MTRSNTVGHMLDDMPPPQGKDRFVESIMYTFFAPLVVYPGWEDSFRDRKMEAIAHRVKHQKEVFQQEQCTEYEAMLYVSSATLVAPPSHDWAEIYFWLFRRWSPKAADSIEIETRALNSNQQEDLARLRAWIFRRQREHLKRRGKDEPASTKPTAETSKIEVIQERMF